MEEHVFNRVREKGVDDPVFQNATLTTTGIPCTCTIYVIYLLTEKTAYPSIHLFQDELYQLSQFVIKICANLVTHFGSLLSLQTDSADMFLFNVFVPSFER